MRSFLRDHLYLYFFCDVVIFKLGKKGLKVAYHVSMVIERSKSIFDGILKWGKFASVTNFSKYCNFTSSSQNIAILRLNSKLGQKGSKLVFHIPMAIEKWKLIVKRNLKWSIIFWNYYLKILSFLTFLKVLTSRSDAVIPKMAEKGPDLYFKYQRW